MPRRDTYHTAVKQALVKDGWTITDDPLHLKWGRKDMYIDLGASQLLAAQRQECKIAVEVKTLKFHNDKQFWMRAGLPAFGIAALLMFGGAGFGFALGMHRISQGGQAKVLSSAELAALQWLSSEEGKQAWELGVHNRGVIQQCFEGLE
ncbi:MAG: element excision factor XisH family protein [Cyanobacteria bacterium J06554_1]